MTAAEVGRGGKGERANPGRAGGGGQSPALQTECRRPLGGPGRRQPQYRADGQAPDAAGGRGGGGQREELGCTVCFSPLFGEETFIAC